MKLGFGVVSVALVLAVACPPTVRAELPPDVYDKMRNEAPESLVVEIASVKTQPGKGGLLHVTLGAKVLFGQRTKADLKKDSSLVIEYDYFDGEEGEGGFTGASSPPLLKMGTEYRVYLKATNGKSFELAAGSESFLPVVNVKIALADGQVLSVADDSEQAGAQVVVAKDGGGLAQQWMLIHDAST
ncbi:MAG: hypothetical protein U0744_11715 [Gemmataceae bacterium]